MTDLGNYLWQVRPDSILRGLLSEWPLAIFSEQLVRLRKRSFPGLVTECGQRIFEDVSRVSCAHHSDGSHVPELEVFGEPLGAGQDDSALRENVPNAPPDFLLGTTIGHWVGGHVEKEEVALLGAKDALVDQALGEALADLLELVADLHKVPCLSCEFSKILSAFQVLSKSLGRFGGVGRPEMPRTTHQVNPGADAHLLARLHHFQSFIEQHLTGQCVINDFNDAIGQGEPAPRGVFLHADAATKGQFYDNATAEGIGYVVVPERKVALRVAACQQRLICRIRKLSSRSARTGQGEGQGADELAYP